MNTLKNLEMVHVLYFVEVEARARAQKEMFIKFTNVVKEDKIKGMCFRN